MLRLPLALATIAAVVCAGSATSRIGAAAPLAPDSPTFVVSGHGWGHGIGMSQYGANGYAQHGSDYAAILAHYYTGTTLGPAPVARVRVLLAQGKASLVVASAGPLKLTDATGKVRKLAAGSYPVGPGPKVRLDPEADPVALPGPLLFAPAAAAPLALGAARYRGSIQVAAVGAKLQAVNILGIDAYVQGVVPREMPSSWEPEALKAQAVAARSYALANLKTGAAFDLYPDTRSQVYGGIAAETPETNDAVAQTAGEVVLYDGEVADTLFFSTSGGRTASIEDVWPLAPPQPYLVSVPDPYDELSPYHDWGPLPVVGTTIARKLHVPGKLLDLQAAVNPSGRVSTVTALGSVGKVAVSGSDVRTALGLRSTWFRVGVLGRLGAQVKTIAFGSKVRLTGVARALPGIVVQSRTPGAAWMSLAAVKPGAGGAVVLVAAPQVTTDFRLASGKVGGVPTRIAVTPKIRFYAVSDPAHLRGYARPLFPGATVQVQRLDGTRWAIVATAVLDDKGVFDASLRLVTGTYRARLAPGHGLAAGYSPPLEVTAR